MKLLLHALGAITLSVFCATTAQATFGCDVLPLPTGFTELHEAPDAASPVITQVPMGANVSMMSEDGSVQGTWLRVAYSTDPEAFWGEGQIGWVVRDHLGNCG